MTFVGAEKRGVGFLRRDSREGLRKRLWSKPGSACSRSLEGEDRRVFDAAGVGRGNLEIGRGRPLTGRVVFLG